MNKRLLYLVLVTYLALGGFSSFAQEFNPICGSDELNNQFIENNKDAQLIMEQFNQDWEKIVKNMELSQLYSYENNEQTIYEIPLVFHIIHSNSSIGSQFNPSDADIEDVVNYLNQTYAATWSNYPDENNGGVDVKIQFTLAKRDPECNPTNGINRINALTELSTADYNNYNTHGVNRNSNYSGGLSDAQIKSLSYWDRDVYYNIWVVNKIDGWSGYVSGGGVVGYAYLPVNAPAHIDGTVIMEAFNKPGESTLPHEIGHALNLYHTFQNGCHNPANCATDGDYICDTDPHTQPSGCPTDNYTCQGLSYSWIPVINNIMNYSSCPDRFTPQQAERMRLALTTLRPSLLNSLGGIAPGNDNLSDMPIAANCIPNLPSTNSYLMGAINLKIEDFEYTSPNYPFPEDDYYIDFAEESCLKQPYDFIHLIKENSYEVKTEHFLNPQETKIWIDYNNDGTLSENEVFFSSYGKGSPITENNSSFKYILNSNPIPSDAELHTPLRMRITNEFLGETINNSCDDLFEGRSYDFTVIIGEPTNTLLSHIEAKANDKSIDLHWQAAEEKDLKYYEIEKSIDGKDFAAIGKALPKGASSNYIFTDIHTEFNTDNFYRLKMIHDEQKITYSKVVSANIKSNLENSINIYPNPFDNQINIESKNEFRGTLKVINILGQEVLTQSNINIKAGQVYSINTDQLQLNANLYHLILISENGNILNRKIIKK